MKLILYSISDENEVINKELGEGVELNGNLLQSTSVTDISLEIEYTPNSRFNYVYVEEFDRYYYIKNLTITSNQTLELSCHCDVLKTYASEILEHTAIIERQENQYNLYLDDTMYKAYQNKKVQFKRLSGTMPALRYFLMVNGGGAQE